MCDLLSFVKDSQNKLNKNAKNWKKLKIYFLFAFLKINKIEIIKNEPKKNWTKNLTILFLKKLTKIFL